MRLFDEEDSSKKTNFWENFRFEWKDCKHFIVGLAFHMSIETHDSFKQAYSLYKKAIRRAESPLPCFNLILSLQLAEARNLPWHEQRPFLAAKLKALKDQFGPYLSYDQSVNGYNGTIKRF